MNKNKGYQSNPTRGLTLMITFNFKNVWVQIIKKKIYISSKAIYKNKYFFTVALVK